MRILFAATVGLLLAFPAGALDPRRALAEYRQTTWTTKDGLPATFIYSITQDSDGYIWIGSTDGLARFDGIQFVHWRPKGNRILLGAVRIVTAARDGGLWVGTASGLVGRVRGDDLTETTLDSPINAILEARDRTLWVATAKHVIRFDPGTLKQISSAIPLTSDFYSGLIQDAQGSIWIATSRGIEEIDAARGEVVLSRAGPKSWLSQERDGMVWSTSPDGHTVPLQQYGAVRAGGPDLGAVVRDNDGNRWIGTLGKGLFRVRPSAEGASPERFSHADGLSNDNVWGLFEDREHNLWVGTQDGLNCLRDGAVTMLSGRESGTDDAEALAAGSDDTVWVATSGGIRRVDSAPGEWFLKGVRPKAFFMDRDKTLWIATDTGLIRTVGGKSSPLPLPSGLKLRNITTIADDDQRRVWIFDADKGLYRWSAGKMDDFSNEPLLRGKSILGMRGDNKGRMWFGLYQEGVVVFDQGAFREYSARDGLARGSVYAVSYDDKGTVWIGAARGLSRFDGSRFVSWNSTQGLPGERVFWILPDHDDGLWLGYTNGVARVTRIELERSLQEPSHAIAYEFFDHGDGLRGNLDPRRQSFAVQTSDGKIWFKTSAGVAFLDPRHIPKNPLPPPVHIERMVADTALVNMENAVRLRPFTRNVEFDYTALSLVEPRRVRFRYKLQGFDSDWQDAGTRRQAFYTNLGPRAYRFQVLACNNDGVWNEAGAALDFELLPAFYQTPWFRLVALVVLMIVGWGVYRIRVRQLAAQLRGRFEERLRERTRIAQELHDSLLQSMLGISLQIEVTDELLPPEFPAKNPLQKALRLSKSAMEEGRRALNDLRTSSLSADDIVKGFSQTADGFRKEGSEVRILVEGHERRLNPVVGHDILQIGRQAIANAFQHSRAGKIRVLLSYSKHELRISVQDNGCGIDEATIRRGRPGHHGIRGMRERAERIGAALSIQSGKGQGTEVDLCVPAELVYQTGDETGQTYD